MAKFTTGIIAKFLNQHLYFPNAPNNSYFHVHHEHDDYFYIRCNWSNLSDYAKSFASKDVNSNSDLDNWILKIHKTKLDSTIQIEDRIFIDSSSTFSRPVSEKWFTVRGFQKSIDDSVRIWIELPEKDGGYHKDDFPCKGWFVYSDKISNIERTSSPEKAEMKNGFLTTKDIAMNEIKGTEPVKEVLKEQPKQEMTFSLAEVRKFEMITPSLIEMARTAIKRIIRWALKKAGKSSKLITHYLAVAQDALDNHKDFANAVIQWVIGFVASQLNKLENLPGIGKKEFMKFFTDKKLERMGEYMKSTAEGSAIGEMFRQIVEWLTVKVFSETSGDLLRFADALNTENGAALAEFAAKQKEILAKEEAELAEEAAAEATAKSKRTKKHSSSMN